MGSALRLPIVSRDSGRRSRRRRHARHGCRVVATVPRGGRSLFDVDLTRPARDARSAAKAPGLPPALVDAADERVTIPMQAPVESLNAAVTAALIVYEAAVSAAIELELELRTRHGLPLSRRRRAAPTRAPAPLAERMRPRTFDEFVGQEDLLAPGKPLREAIERDLLQSIILWGPPGTGKTTLARIIADTTQGALRLVQRGARRASRKSAR